MNINGWRGGTAELPLRMGLDDIEAIVAASLRGKSTEDNLAVRLVDHAEIKDNGWDLNIGRYLKAAATEAADVPTALAALKAAQAALRACR